MKKKIVVFTGAGISKESGIDTFRDAQSGLWYNFNVDDVATPEGWKKDRNKVLDFYNQRRSQLPLVQPNDAHKALAALEAEYDVCIVTQNIDDLHERSGSTDIIHLHGELTKARGSAYINIPNWLDKVIDIGYGEIKVGDLCPHSSSQLRPHIVWFGEYPFGVDEAYSAIRNADVLMIVGTSLQISYTLNILRSVKTSPTQAEIIYIDPKPMHYLDNYGLSVEYIEKTAVEGVTEVVNRLITQAIGTHKNDE